MRIAVIGDLQYAPNEVAQIEAHMREINAQRPDIAIFLGDMGAHGATGTLAGMRAAKGFLDILNCPTSAIMGNHDVEYRPDDATPKTPDIWYSDVFGRNRPWRAMEFAGAFILCLSVERQIERTLMTQHALCVSDSQYAWAREQLRAHRDTPTLLFTHAPMAGSGLRSFPPIHSAATDAYLDHGFDAMRWRCLAEENPQIRLWCSAHFHMGHDYASAITYQGGAAHVSAGVMTSAARDGSRHTRFIDINAGFAEVYTLDHATPAPLRLDAALKLSGGEPEGLFAEPVPGEVLLGDDRALAAYAAPNWERAYIITETGKLWEYDYALRELTGAIALKLDNPPDIALWAKNDRLCVEETEYRIWSVQKDDPARFERLSGYVPRASRAESHVSGAPLYRMPLSQRSSREGWYARLGVRQ